MRQRIVPLLALLLVGPTLLAEQSPGVREIQANERGISPLTTKLRYTTVIILPDGEDIVDVICGDKDNWVINSDKNHAFIKPALALAATNLNLLTTTGAIYSFALREDPKAQTDLKVYVVADPAASQKPQKYVPVATLSELAEALAALRTDIKSVETAMGERHATPNDAARVAASLRYPYVWDKPKGKLAIREISHDAERTYIRLESPRQGASLYEVTSSGRELVTFSLEDGFYTVDKVLQKGVLVLGKDTLEFSATRRSE